MKNWTVKNSEFGANYEISGETLQDAIEQNFKRIADQANLGNAAGYHVVDVSMQYKEDILGGKGGVELEIIHTGLPLANGKKDDEEKVATVWIYADPSDAPKGKLVL